MAYGLEQWLVYGSATWVLVISIMMMMIMITHHSGV